MIVDRERGAVVTGHPATSKLGAAHTPLRATALTPCGVPGAPLSRSARTGPLAVAGVVIGSHQPGSIPGRPGTDRQLIPAGGMVRERVATHKPSAATVTQGAGVPCKGYLAPFLAQRQAGQPGGNSEPRDLERLPASVGGR